MIVNSKESLYLVYIKESRVRDVQVNLTKRPNIESYSINNDYYNAEENWGESWCDMEGELVAGLVKANSKDEAIGEVMRRLKSDDNDAFGVFELKEI